MLLCGVCLCSVASARRARRVMRGVDELRLEVPKEDGYVSHTVAQLQVCYELRVTVRLQRIIF